MDSQAVGNLRVSGHESESFTFSWTLNKFSSLVSESSASIRSETFTFGESGLKWFLAANCEDSKSEKENVIRFSLRRAEEPETCTAYERYAVSLRNSKQEVACRGSVCTDQTSDSRGFSVGRRAVLQHLDDDVLEVSVELFRSASTVTMPEKTQKVAEASPGIVLSGDLKQLLKSGRNSDITIAADGVDMPAHKTILLARSRVFAAMFEQHSSERVELPDFTAPAVQAMLQFLYTGTVDELGTGVALELLVAADKFQVADMKTFCSNFLVSRLDVSNIARVMACADQHSFEDLRELAIAYLLDNIGSFDFENGLSVLEGHPVLLCEIVKRMANLLLSERSNESEA